MSSSFQLHGLTALASVLLASSGVAQDKPVAAQPLQEAHQGIAENQPPTTESAEAIRGTAFRRNDRNHDGKLTFPEAFPDKRPSDEKADEQRRHVRRKLRCREAFRATDTDGSSDLSQAEFLQGEFALSALSDSGSDSTPVPDPVMELVERAVASLFSSPEETLTPSVWKVLPWKNLSPDLEGLERVSPDSNRDGTISREEVRRVVEIAYGARRPDGALMRFPDGQVFINMYFEQWDKNQDGKVSLEEFASKYRTNTMTTRLRRIASNPRPEKVSSSDANADRQFLLIDTNQDGFLAPSEIHPILADDRFTLFLYFDQDLDGGISLTELLAKTKSWKPEMVTSLFSAGDDDRSESLSFREFCLTPFLNRVRDWSRKRKDTNRDTLLSYAEFQPDSGLFASALSRRFFRLLDQNHDGTLGYDEFAFDTDRDKIPPAVAFQVQDRDRDGKLAFKEVFTEAKPSATDKPALQRYEMRLGAAESRFLADDRDRDGTLSPAEFQQSREAALAAVERKTKALSRHRRTSGGDWFYPMVLALNACIALGGGWYLFRRSA